MQIIQKKINVKIYFLINLYEKLNLCSAVSRCILVPFERYGRQKNVPKKVLVTLSIYISPKN